MSNEQSRRPMPKTRVPTIPVMMGRRSVVMVTHTKKMLMKRLAVRSSTGTGVMPRSSTPTSPSLES